MSYLSVFRNFALLAAFALTLAAQPAAAGPLAPAAPQPRVGWTAPGLAVDYLRIDALRVEDIESAGRGKTGKPLAMLNWSMGSGPVLTHADDDGIAARITGYIKFETVGDYRMKIKSNDGVRLFIGGQVIIDDSDVHIDRFSEIATVQVPSPGWYPVYLLYFERRGTATLELYWQTPDKNDFEFVPAAAFAHRSNS